MKFVNEDLASDQIRTALSFVPGGFVIYGPSHELIYVNDTARDHFPYLYSTLETGASLRDSITAEISEQYPAADQSRINTMVSYVHSAVLNGSEIEMPTSTGRYVRTLHARLPNGGYVGIAHDITELRIKERKLLEATQKAEAANKAKSAFLASMSHEIRTPLNGILGMSQALASRQLDNDERDMIATIVESSHNLMAVLNDILDISRIEAGKLSISPVPGDLRHKLSRIESFYRPIAAEKGLWFRMVVSPDVPAKLQFDPIRMRQCIDNLVSNALKFTSKGGVIVAVALDEGSTQDTALIKVHVSDTGIGINEDKYSSVFEVFTQADGATTRQYGGSGLGLSISRKLARHMGGDVTVASKEGQGSVFTLTFSAKGLGSHIQSNIDDDSEGLEPIDGLSGKRILVVDDNDVNRRVARLFLEPGGAIVSEASNGQHALEHLAQAPVDVVLLDVHMPVLNGPETLKAIRASGQSWSGVPIIALTADAMSGDRDRYIAMGMDGYVSKPIEERMLMTALLEQIARHEWQKPSNATTAAKPYSVDEIAGVDASAILSAIDEIVRKRA